ncbi:MAG: hypothetical protein A3G25_15975 [Betaproteobacteria bacterium RIFCSPLOWO2_12_FULL_63_13]|nr:MAG: hypothetical protein A3H32_12450 [Betaproteobacteria bacterium RIFCSPLOWO2_02_FULL_63_19]OGA42972.1 MAG: hypothetical protein A3G25_15975 [Betaproteobacteria bacterium RIFCSPLOWO2_12_FULL_63_13]
MSRLLEIRTRRAHLMASAAVERERIRAQLRAWEAPFALADTGICAARYLRRHPQWIIGPIVLFAVLRPRRALSWARNGVIAWRAWRWVVRSGYLRVFAMRLTA